MIAVNQSNIAVAMLFLQHGHGQNNVNTWFSVDVRITGRIALYQHILACKQPEKHQPLLDFHTCRIHVANAPADNQASSLRTFNSRWPLWVGHTIESFLLPSKEARQTMEQVRLQFVSTLNDCSTHGKTPLFVAVSLLNVDAVKFLLKQKGIDVNKLSTLRHTGGTVKNLTPLAYLTLQVTLATTPETDEKKLARETISDLLRQATDRIEIDRLFSFICLDYNNNRIEIAE